ncbi:MAG: rod shape-determining protein RodA [Pseudomonadales bacterium]
MSGQDFVRSLPGADAPRVVRSGGFAWDPPLLLLLSVVIGFGLMVLYSAADRNTSALFSQMTRVGLGIVVMLVAAQFPPRFYLRWSPLIYGLGLVLVLLVLSNGVVVNGSRRWLEIPGVARFQPSELLKLAVPMMVAWYFHERPLPPSFKDLLVALFILALPAALVVLQPDLGTGILVATAGFAVILLAGLQWRYLLVAAAALGAIAPIAWYGLQEYQQRRILTLFDPESDPLGAGWNIMQSTTAIGSGGLEGKGLFRGTQSHLDFLPESHTDFIIAVIGEELGFMGVLFVLLLYVSIVARCLYTAALAKQTYSRLLSGALTLTFFVYVFVNIAMVSGMLPVVGVPLPLISYGGTSAITLLAGFGIIMSIHSHKSW